MKLNTVREIGFIPAVGETGDTTTVRIRKLVLYYRPTPIIHQGNVLKSPVISLFAIRKGRYILTVPEQGKYTVKFFSVKGREVLSMKNITCKKGANIISVDQQALASGVYLVRVNTKTLKSAPGKIIIRK